MKIYFGADHGGFQLKEELKKFVTDLSYQAEDMGAHIFDAQDDYPDFIIPTAKAVIENPGSFGVVIGRSGNGEAICANKIKGIRCALGLSVEMAKKAKEHNDANILSLGADYVSVESAKKIIETFLKTPFSNEERHVRRIEKIRRIEEERS